MENSKPLEGGHFAVEVSVENGHWEKFDEEKMRVTGLCGMYFTVYNEGTFSASTRYEISLKGVVTMITDIYTTTQVNMGDEIMSLPTPLPLPGTGQPHKLGYNASIATIEEEGQKPVHILKYEINSKLISVAKRSENKEE